MVEIKRATAYKLWIKDLVSGRYMAAESAEDTPYLDVKGIKVSRVNLIASTVLIYKSEDGNYANLTLDDGSGDAVRVKAWREDTKLLGNVKVGDLVNVIGRVRLFNKEVYVLPEIVKVMDDANWGRLRRIELSKMYGLPEITPVQPKRETAEIIMPKSKEITINENNIEEIDFTKPETDTITERERQKVLGIIESAGDNGVRVMEVALKTQLSEEQTENIIKELVKEGEIFHPKPGFVQYIG